MTTLALWQRIAKQAHKVPDLEVFADKSYLHNTAPIDGFTVKLGCAIVGFVTGREHPHQHRDAAMRVVDAIEAAGLAKSSRFAYWDGDEVEWQFHDQANYPIASQSGPRNEEHLTLLDALALTLEALPEVENG